MKNMKISAKLIVTFAIVITLAIIVGGIGIAGMNSINNADDALYRENLVAVSAMGGIRENLQSQRLGLRDYALNAGNPDKANEIKATIERVAKSMEEDFAIYEGTITDTTVEDEYFNAKKIYESQFSKLLDAAYETSRTNNTQAVYDMIYAPDVAEYTNTMVKGFTASMENNERWAKEGVDNNTTLFKQMATMEIILLVIAVGAAVFLAFYISGLIGKPIAFISNTMDSLSKTGNFNIDDETDRKAEELRLRKDETGRIMNAFIELVEMMQRKLGTLESVSSGDLTADIVHRSADDSYGNAFQKMVDRLNGMFSEIYSSANQVSVGSSQIADGAQLLAQGATEQSATVEELSASITEVAAKTKENAVMANDAKELGEKIKASAEQGSGQMEQMMVAVHEINESSKSIGKVIKIIDDIAFQTNILALNAAVEAARAGQHGKGFAVVADEVRNLAAKSAEAAKNTNELIESSIQKAEQGASISAETSESLRQIVDGILHTSELIAEISKSSDEQTIAIGQISDAVSQVSQVVQQNSATAEESAAASEEMSGQASMLQQLISQFKIKGVSQTNSSNRFSGAQNTPQSSGMALQDVGMDKY